MSEFFELKYRDAYALPAGALFAFLVLFIKCIDIVACLDVVHYPCLSYFIIGTYFIALLLGFFAFWPPSLIMDGLKAKIEVWKVLGSILLALMMLLPGLIYLNLFLLWQAVRLPFVLAIHTYKALQRDVHQGLFRPYNAEKANRIFSRFRYIRLVEAKDLDDDGNWLHFFGLNEWKRIAEPDWEHEGDCICVKNLPGDRSGKDSEIYIQLYNEKVFLFFTKALLADIWAIRQFPWGKDRVSILDPMSVFSSEEVKYARFSFNNEFMKIGSSVFEFSSIPYND